MISLGLQVNKSIDTDPQQQEAASPQVLGARSFLRSARMNWRSALTLFSIAASASLFATEMEPRYAVTESTMTGPRGSISLTQIGLVDPPAAQAKCDGQLEADRKNKGLAVISTQRCLTQLPTHLAIAVERKPLPDAYVFFVENSVLFFRTKSVHVVKYHFESGPSSETCDRWLTGYRKIDPSAVCIPPEPKK